MLNHIFSNILLKELHPVQLVKPGNETMLTRIAHILLLTSSTATQFCKTLNEIRKHKHKRINIKCTSRRENKRLH